MILLVEDDPALVTLFQRLLQEEGFEVISAMNGSKGKKILKQHASNIKVAIIDSELSDMNGLQLVQYITEKHSKIKIILCAHLNDPVQKFLQHDTLALLVKPFSVEHLLNTIHTLVPASIVSTE